MRAQECSLGPLDRYTDDFVLSATSTAGAVGDVLPIELSLTVGAFHGRLYAIHVVGCYDKERLELVGGPVYSDVFQAFTWISFFFDLGGETGPNSIAGAKGFVLDANVVSDQAAAALESGLPLPVATLYFRVKGVPGDLAQVRFCDEEFVFQDGSCLRSALEFQGDDAGPLRNLHAHSRFSLPGTVAILPGEPTRSEPPPLPPQVKVYPVPPTPESAEIRFELSGGVVRPGATGVPVELAITSNFDFSMYSAAARFPARYLELERVEMKTSGLSDFDNDRGELWLVSGQSGRRIGAEGERVSVATLHFTVKEAAAEVGEVAVTFESFPVEQYSYVNWIGILSERGVNSQELPVMTQVEPLTVASALLKIQPQATTLGDVNLDYDVSLTDAVALLGTLFKGENSVVCAEAADFNEDGKVDISDPVGILRYLFLGGRSTTLSQDVFCDG